MTEFTSERIKKYREFLRSTNPEHSSHTVVASLALDEIERLQAENAEIKHLCVFALHGLGKLTYEQWHTGDWVHDEIWTKYRKIADELYNEFGKKYKALKRRVKELEQERQWIHQDKTLILKKDGDSWCAVLPDFENLQQSESRWFSGDINKYMDDVYWYLNNES